MPSQNHDMSAPRRMIPFPQFYRNRVSKTTAFDWKRRGLVRTFKVRNKLYTDETFDEFVARVGEQAGGE